MLFCHCYLSYLLEFTEKNMLVKKQTKSYGLKNNLKHDKCNRLQLVALKINKC